MSNIFEEKDDHFFIMDFIELKEEGEHFIKMWLHASKFPTELYYVVEDDKSYYRVDVKHNKK